MDSNLTQSIAAQYDHFQFLLEAIRKERKYLNYGYSRTRGESYEQKQEQLCLAVFTAAEIGPDDVLVDVGFGSGEQDFLLADRFAFQKCIGYNIAGAQVEYARRRAAEAGLGDRLEFREGEAEHMPQVDDASVDRVLAVECAFYFDRPRFYREAARVLKPGGRLVLADICFHDRFAFLTRKRENLKRVGSLGANRKLWEEHFHTRTLQSINRETYPGAQKTVFVILKLILKHFRFSQRRAWATLWKMAVSTQIVALGFRTGFLHYDLIVVEKK